jgi:hypothetical protein
MSSDVIAVNEWLPKKWIGRRIVERVLRHCTLARFLRRHGPLPAPKAQPAGTDTERVSVRNELRLWPKPGIMC